MELVPCEWPAGGTVILVWNWCPVNGQLCWYGTSAGLELKFYELDIFKF